MINDPLDQPIQKLSQSLSGVIDAAVNGGIFKYQEAFFPGPNSGSEGEEVEVTEPEHVPRLRRLMFDQVSILEQALQQHERLVSSEMKPLHEHLVGRWRHLKESLEKLPDAASATSARSDGASPVPSARTKHLHKSLSSTPSSRKGPLPPLPKHHSTEETYSNAIMKRPSVALRNSLTSLYGHAPFFEGGSNHSSHQSTSSASSSVLNVSSYGSHGPGQLARIASPDEDIYSRPSNGTLTSPGVTPVTSASAMSMSMSALPMTPARGGGEEMVGRSLFAKNDYQQIDAEDFIDDVDGELVDEGIRADAPPLPPRMSALHLPERPRNRVSKTSSLNWV